jgi:hypothetical protein
MTSNSNFGVAVRVRPDDSGLKSCVKISGNTIFVTEERHNREPEKSFAFDKVFDESAKQEDVFAEVAATVDAVPNGFHGCIFAYGPTGSGAFWMYDCVCVFRKGGRGGGRVGRWVDAQLWTWG